MLAVPHGEVRVRSVAGLVGAQSRDPGGGSGEGAGERFDFPYLAARQPRVFRMIEAVHPLVRDKRGKRVGVRMKGADPRSVALLRLLPDRMRLGEQPAGVECRNLDRQALGENVVSNELVFDAEAGGEDKTARYRARRGVEALGNSRRNCLGEPGGRGRICSRIREICVSHFGLLRSLFSKVAFAQIAPHTPPGDRIMCHIRRETSGSTIARKKRWMLQSSMLALGDYSRKGPDRSRSQPRDAMTAVEPRRASATLHAWASTSPPRQCCRRASPARW